MTQEELKNIAPKLSEIKSIKTGFEIPDGYFETVKNSIIAKIDFDTEVSNNIPEGYFDTIEDRVFEKINSKETKLIYLKSKFIKIVTPIAIAASILLLITLQLFNQPQEDVFANVNTSEIETWINNGELDIDTYEITSVYDDVIFDNIELNDNYTDDDLLNYLDNIDLESLILTN